MGVVILCLVTLSTRPKGLGVCCGNVSSSMFVGKGIG